MPPLGRHSVDDTMWEPDGSTTSERCTYAILGMGTGRVKIGSAGDVLRRGADLQVGSPVELVLLATCRFNIERRMHHALASEWVHGEWFRLSDATARLIAQRMEPRLHSFANDVPVLRGRRDARDVRRVEATDSVGVDAVGMDAFGPFDPESRLRPVSAREDMLRMMSRGQRDRLAAELRRISEEDGPRERKRPALRLSPEQMSAFVEYLSTKATP